MNFLKFLFLLNITQSGSFFAMLLELKTYLTELFSIY